MWGALEASCIIAATAEIRVRRVHAGFSWLQAARRITHDITRDTFRVTHVRS